MCPRKINQRKKIKYQLTFWLALSTLSFSIAIHITQKDRQSKLFKRKIIFLRAKVISQRKPKKISEKVLRFQDKQRFSAFLSVPNISVNFLPLFVELHATNQSANTTVGFCTEILENLSNGCFRKPRAGCLVPCYTITGFNNNMSASI